MRMRGRVNTSQIEDRRGSGGRGLAVGGGGLGIAGVVLGLVLSPAGGGGEGVADVLRQLEAPSSTTQDSQPLSCPKGADTNTACFVTGVVNDVQDTWTRIFQEQGKSYQATKLVLFSDATSSGCGR